MRNVLIIDDDIDLGEFVTQAIDAMGLHCVVTTNAADFWEALGPDTDLIFLDLLMPDIDGVEMLRLLARRRCGAGIVLMSGIGARVIESAAELAATLGLKIIGRLQKPFRIAELEALVRKEQTEQVVPEAECVSAIDITDEDLIAAIERDEFILHFQPQIDLATGGVCGMEALARWKHPHAGLVCPDIFIKHAERLNVIDALSWSIFRLGLSALNRFACFNLQAPILSINVSTQSLRDLSFPDTLLALLRRYNVTPQQIIVEITESGLLDELSSTLDVLTRLRMKGIPLSIDDFGTGYAMMQQLRRIPANELKIDRTFVAKMLDHYGDRVMVQKTIEMGHELGLKVVAEGVETQEQLDFLRSQHCDVAQGYLFSRALPINEFILWMHLYRPIEQSTTTASV
ncbi:MAG: EAL domain-containing response regulator [Acidobacteriota bacterium]